MRHLSDEKAACLLQEVFPDRLYCLGEYQGSGSQGDVWEITGADQPAVCKFISVEPLPEMNLNEDEAENYRKIMVKNAMREEQALRLFSNSRYFPTLIDARVFVPEGGGKREWVYLFVEEKLYPFEANAKQLGLTPKKLAVRVGRDISCAIQEMEKRSWEHRDLKCPNLFVRKNSDKTFNVVVSDLGTASKFSGKIQTLLGTAGHVPPEKLHKKKPVLGRGDMYSLAVVILEIAYERDLYIANEVEQRKEIEKLLSELQKQDPELCGLLRKMLCVNPRQRISATQAARAFESMMATAAAPRQLSSDARRALAAFQRGDAEESLRLSALLPETDARRHLLQSLLAGTAAERIGSLRIAAKLGSPAGMFYMAQALFSGREGLRSNPKLAVEYLTFAAKAQYPPACRQLAMLCGEKVENDTPESRITFLLNEIAA